MEVKAERVKPYDSQQSKAGQIERMFDSIAPAYDWMNRAMTFGIDRRWRDKAVRMLRSATAHPTEILDVATGTGDLAITLAREFPEARVSGIDLSRGMIEIGRRKVADAGFAGRVTLTTADCLALPFADNSFDCITVAYGVRNFEHLDRGYREMARVLRPGGMLVVIELSTPTCFIVKPFYSLYTRGVIPLLGRAVSKDQHAYSYLLDSIAAVPQGETMLALMNECGLIDCTYRPLTLGVCTIYRGYKPAAK